MSELTKPSLDELTEDVADRIRADIFPGEKCWIVQRCTQRWVNHDGSEAPRKDWGKLTTQLQYEDWPGYDTPMTHVEMEAALQLCGALWPEHEFRGHRLMPRERRQA